MSRSIDSGKILYKKFFDNPKNLSDIENNFDEKVRAITLVEFLKRKKKYKNRLIKDVYYPYYIAHPIIRYLALKLR